MPQTVWCRVSLLLKNDSVKWHIYFFTFLLCLLNAKTLFLHSSMLLTSSPYQLSVCRHQVNQHSLVCTRKTIKVDKNQDKDHKQHKIYGEGGRVNVCKLQHCCTLSDRKWWWLSAAAVCSHRVQQLQLDSDIDTDPAGLYFTLGCGILYFCTSSESSSS